MSSLIAMLLPAGGSPAPRYAGIIIQFIAG